jgi:hypothetical protein
LSCHDKNTGSNPANLGILNVLNDHMLLQLWLLKLAYIKLKLVKKVIIITLIYRLIRREFFKYNYKDKINHYIVKFKNIQYIPYKYTNLRRNIVPRTLIIFFLVYVIYWLLKKTIWIFG